MDNQPRPLQPGDRVVRATRRGRRSSTSRRAFVPGTSGTVGGNASAHLSVNTEYVVEALTPEGGVRLHGFTLPVSIRDLRRVE